MVTLLALVKKHWLFLIIFIGIVFLRFSNLGYSDYAGDEVKALFRPADGASFSQFFLSQRKGPGQFLVTYIPYLFVHSYTNEFVVRLPFALANIGAMFVLYLFLLRMTKKIYMSALGTALVGFCGFIVGFSRIVQYQDLNLLFGILSLYFFSFLDENDKNPAWHFTLGTLFWAMSFLSHWDAVFISPVNLYFIIRYVTSYQAPRKKRLEVIIIGLASILILAELFLFPYLNNLRQNAANYAYVGVRLGFKITNPLLYKNLIELYNPFVSFWLYMAGLALFLVVLIANIVVKKLQWFYTLVFIWFVVDFLFFVFYFKDPRTHIYNFIFPGLLLCAIGFSEIFDFFHRHFLWFPLKLILPAALSAVILFTAYQDYVLFVDHTHGEYPYVSKQVWRWRTIGYWNNPSYQKPWELPWFGFPHSRQWNTIVADMQSFAGADYPNYTYVSTEKSVITHFYTQLSERQSPNFFAIAVRDTTDFQDYDWQLNHVPDKKLLKTYYLNRRQIVKLFVVKTL